MKDRNFEFKTGDTVVVIGDNHNHKIAIGTVANILKVDLQFKNLNVYVIEGYERIGVAEYDLVIVKTKEDA